MIHIHSIRITDSKKCLKPRLLKGTFLKTVDEINAFEQKELQKYIDLKYPKGIPITRDLKSKPLACNATYIDIPDREFLHYLVAVCNMKSIPQKYLNLFRKNDNSKSKAATIA